VNASDLGLTRERLTAPPAGHDPHGAAKPQSGIVRAGGANQFSSRLMKMNKSETANKIAPRSNHYHAGPEVIWLAQGRAGDA
jgi:hypothetical protein